MPPLSVLRHRAMRLLRQPRRRQTLLLEAILCLGLARMALLAVSFPRLARHLGRFAPPEEGRLHAYPAAPRPEHARLASDIGWAVVRAARFGPVPALCLPQAMAAKIMLRRRGVPSTLWFGVARDPATGLKAHAWLSAAGVEVTGTGMAPLFTEIACFL